MSTATVPEAREGYFPHWKLKTTGVIMPEERLPCGRTIVSGMQHGVAMAGGTIIAPLIMGFDPNRALLFSGLGTLIFFIVVAGRVPSYLGSSFSFIAVVIAASGYSGHGPNPNLDVALGGIIAAGVLYGILALIVMQSGVGWVERLMPPIVTGAVVAAIGLNLAPVAVKSVSGSQFDVLDWVVYGSSRRGDRRRSTGNLAQIADHFRGGQRISAVFIARKRFRSGKAHRLFGIGRGAVDRFAEIHRSELPR
jgi:xanthine/uracil permease